MKDQYPHEFLRIGKVSILPLSTIHFHIEGTLQAIAEHIMEVASSHTVNYQDPGSSYLTLLFFRMCTMSVQIEMLILKHSQRLRGLNTTIKQIWFEFQVKILCKQWPPKLSLSKKHLSACFKTWSFKFCGLKSSYGSTLQNNNITCNVKRHPW